MHHVTFVDDLQENLDFYKDAFEGEYSLSLIQDPSSISDHLENHETQIIVLDLHMPKISGLELYNKLKEKYEKIPFILISGDKAEANVIKALEDGADDFIVKPVGINELKARINNKIRAYQKLNKDKSVLKIQDFTLYTDFQQGEIDGEKIQLTPIEFKIINLLMKHPNKIFSREYITKLIWPDVHVQNQNIDTHLSNLRRKLKPFSQNIKTIKSRGYILRI